MIEWHVDLIAPWWIIPLYIGCLAGMAAAIFLIIAAIDRWRRRP